jgi:hypothetical protein
MGQDGEVPLQTAELSSIASILEQVTARITAMAESAHAAHEGELARDLFGVERSLTTAKRRVDKLANSKR